MTIESIHQVVGIRLSKDTLFEYIKNHREYIYTLLLEEYKRETPSLYQVNVNVLEARDIPGWIFNNFIYDKSIFTNSKVKIFNVSHKIDDDEYFIIGSVVSSILLYEDNHNIKASISDILNASREMESYFQIIGLKESVNLYTVTQHN